jgi:hypothetical protein
MKFDLGIGQQNGGDGYLKINLLPIIWQFHHYNKFSSNN